MAVETVDIEIRFVVPLEDVKREWEAEYGTEFDDGEYAANIVKSFREEIFIHEIEDGCQIHLANVSRGLIV